MRILIVGGTRFIGPFLIKELLDKGHEVAIFSRGNNKLDSSLSEKVTHFVGDMSRLMDYKEDFRSFAPHVVVHMIAFTEIDAQIAMSTFEGVTDRIVVSSSIDVYQAYGNLIRLENVPTIPVPFNEDGPLRKTLHPYGGDYEKQLVERVILSKPLELPGTVLRLPMVYGEGDPSHRLYKYVKRALDKRDSVLLDDQYANWRGSRGHVENVSHAITLAATEEVAQNCIYNVGEEPALSEKEWIQMIAKVMKWDAKVHSVPKSDLPERLVYSLLDLRQDWVVDTSRIRKELGYNERVTKEDAISRTVIWEEKNPPKELHPKDFPRFDYELEDLVLAKIV
jgi:nucleoside-diphosphate-sugar epimerase